MSQIWEGSSGTWILDDDVLQSLGNDLQRIVDCTQPGDTLLFDTRALISPAKKTIIPWNLTLSTLENDNRNISESSKKTNFTCPPNDGVFLIR